jgi:hypothetical protein
MDVQAEAGAIPAGVAPTSLPPGKTPSPPRPLSVRSFHELACLCRQVCPVAGMGLIHGMANPLAETVLRGGWASACLGTARYMSGDVGSAQRSR